MKQIFAVFCAIILMPGMSAHAWVGGPWSNNNHIESGDDGIYEAVATMTNGIGLYRWAVRNNGVSSTGGGTSTSATDLTSSNVLFGGGILGAASSNVWYYRGITYYGPCFGVVNSAMGIVTAVSNTSTDGGLAQIGTSLNNIPVTGGTPGIRDGLPTVTIIPQPDPEPSIIIASPAEPLSTQNVGFANSSFMAKISSKAPVKRFSGSGSISFSGAVDNIQRSLSFTETTVPSGSDFTENIVSTGGEDSSFPQRGHLRKFKVMGTQVSTVVLP